jgi:hypothetical protein
MVVLVLYQIRPRSRLENENNIDKRKKKICLHLSCIRFASYKTAVTLTSDL